ncbi:MAG TPA: OmpA family protein [Acidobacteriota bacterium]|nr:OmpA family protein [Acidobacteriota bacterium]
MNRIFRGKALGWALVVILAPLFAGCAWRGPASDCDTSGEKQPVYVEPEVTQVEFDGLEGRVTDLERRMSANEELAQDAMMTADKALKCCRKDYTIVMTEEIYFDFNKFDVKAESSAALDRVADKLKSDPDLIAELAGHTDGKGTSDYNIVLGQKRADAARQYLISRHNIALGRLALRTFGEDAPIASNDSDEGRSKNRRVTIDVLGFSQ